MIETLPTATIETAPEKRLLVADLFCGAGGSSTGAQKAITSIGGAMELVAVNHWPVAVETHQRNHPAARHYVENLENADPELIVPEGYLDLLMASPECKYYSRAKGGKPIQDQGRMSPWIIQRWLTSLDVRILLVENVPEFVQWGPLIPRTKRPDPAKKGITFQTWIKSLWDLGYDVDWRNLNAADFGDATTRVRFFLQARNDGRPIIWPEASHSKHGEPTLTGHLPKWRGAREIIDWSNQGRSILDDPKYRKKPLSINTRRRIAKGLVRFGGPLAQLYIRLLDLSAEDNPAPEGNHLFDQQDGAFLINRHGENGSQRIHSIALPVPTTTCRGAGYFVRMEADPIGQENQDNHQAFHSSGRQNTSPRTPSEPLHTATTLTGGGLYKVETIAEPFIHANRNHNAPKHLDQPVPTATSAPGGGTFFLNPDMIPFILGQQSDSAPRDTSEPLPTIAGAGAISLTTPEINPAEGNPIKGDEESPAAEQPTTNPIIIQYFGQSVAQGPESPISTILSARKHALVNTILVQYFGNSHSSDVEKPVPAVTTKARYAIAEPSLLQVNHPAREGENDDSRIRDTEGPLGTITTKRDTAIADPVLLQVNHGNGSMGAKGDDRRVHSLEDPAPGITTNPGLALADPILVQTSQTGGNGKYSRDPDQPLGTITTKNDMALTNPGLEPAPEEISQALTPEPYLVPNFGEAEGQSPRTHGIDDPAPATTSHGAGNLVNPVMQQALLEELGRKGIDPRRLLLINGQPWILDIRFRMLQNNELAKAMGFDDDEFKYEFSGNITQITKQIGNAVPVNLAAALVKSAIQETAAAEPPPATT